MSEDASSPTTFFGLSRVLDDDEVDRLERFLSSAWETQHGRPPGSFSADLDRLKYLFGAESTPRRLREAISKLARLKIPVPSVPPILWVPVDDRRGFVTPEGRAALEQFRRLREQSRNAISTSEVAVWAELVAMAYGDWRREWMRKHIAGAGLRPGSFGWLLLLLVNGAVSRQRALRLPADVDEERELAEVLIPVIDAFAEPLGGESQSDREGSRLRSNWRVTQARALMYDVVNREDVKDDAFFWIEPEEQAISQLAQRLAGRASLDYRTLETALEAFVTAYGRARPVLSAFDAAHDRSAHTRHVVNSLLDRFSAERAA